MYRNACSCSSNVGIDILSSLRGHMETVKFLDYAIINTGNGDDWVLTKPGGELWERHLGNYNDVNSAKKYAFLYFLAAHPEDFSHMVIARIRKTGIYMEYFTFLRALAEWKIPLPPEISASEDGNFSILFNGEKI